MARAHWQLDAPMVMVIELSILPHTGLQLAVSPEPSILVVRVVDDGPLCGQLDGSHGGHGPSKHSRGEGGAAHPLHLVGANLKVPGEVSGTPQTHQFLLVRAVELPNDALQGSTLSLTGGR